MISFLEILLRLGLALILGALVGFERESTEHAAGMRTNALVAMGASLFTVISAYGFMSLLGIPHISLDPTRIASYVIAGIGFLGGGSIFMRRDGVRGLTTAAAIWTVAAIGMACGAGFYWEAAAATGLTIFVLYFLRYVERLLLPKQFEEVRHIQIQTGAIDGAVIGAIYDICTRQGLVVEAVRTSGGEDGEVIDIKCRVPDPAKLSRAVGELRVLKGVASVEAEMRSA